MPIAASNAAPFLLQDLNLRLFPLISKLDLARESGMNEQDQLRKLLHHRMLPQSRPSIVSSPGQLAYAVLTIPKKYSLELVHYRSTNLANALYNHILIGPQNL